MQHIPLIKDVLLVGGGHTHALVIRKWAMNPLPGVRLTLVSRDVLTPYSGMLPAYLAGHYTHDETHIDLARLCQWAGVRFVKASVTGLVPDQQLALLDNRPAQAALGYDLVSINTGSTPDTSKVPGASEFAVPVKPVNRFADSWQTWVERVADSDSKGDAGTGSTSDSGSVGVVGAGVGGFELLLSMQHAFRKRGHESELHWFIRRHEPLKGQPEKVRKRALEICREREIQVHTEFDVAEVKKGSLVSTTGTNVAVDEILWVTAAGAPSWPAQAGLATTDRGFIEVNEHLQSTSHSNIFACGDVASQRDKNTPKAGVFAVRQAPVLYDNLRKAALGQTALRKFTPQQQYLTLISLGEKRAIASRNGFSVEGDWVWGWKHQIDWRFMQKFSRLPEIQMQNSGVEKVSPALLKSSELDVDDFMFCGGCGAKVGPSVLASVIAELQPEAPDSSSDSSQSRPSGITEDACVIDAGGKRLVQSVDQIRSHIADPFLFGRVAALHALSDVFVANAEADSALALVTLPFSEADVQARDLRALMSGAVMELDKAGCRLAGGHSSIGPECMLGFVVNGIERPETGTAAELCGPLGDGDAVILTKPLGVGVIMAAHMRNLTAGDAVEQALEIMLQSNHESAGIFLEHGAYVMTDVTGFGLLGHLQNLVARINFELSQSETDGSGKAVVPDKLAVRVKLESVPVLDKALALSSENVKSSLFKQNAHFLKRAIVKSSGNGKTIGSGKSNGSGNNKARERLLLDPQTNGGVLAVVPKSRVAMCLDALEQACPGSCQIGVLEPTDASGHDVASVIVE